MFTALDISVEFELTAVYDRYADEYRYGKDKCKPIETVMENITYLFMSFVGRGFDVEYVIHALVNLTLFDDR